MKMKIKSKERVRERCSKSKFANPFSSASKKIAISIISFFATYSTDASVFYVNDRADAGCGRMGETTSVVQNANCQINSVSGFIEEGGINEGGSMTLNSNGLFLNGRMEINGSFRLNSHKISGLIAGTENLDAINVGQARAIVTNLGGGAAIAADGSITSPSYTIGGATFNDVGTALESSANKITVNSNNIGTLQSDLGLTTNRLTTAEGNVTSLTTQVNNLATGVGGIVTYDANTNAVNVASAQAGSLVNLAGTAGVRTLSGVKDATLDISSNEAVTGSQLFATNGRVTTTEGNVTSLTTQVNNLATGVGGIVTYDANTNAVNVASAQAGSLVNLAGTAGVRTLSGVKDATLDISSNEAVTGSQLFATNGRVTTTEGNVTSLTTQVNNLATGVGGIVTYDTNTNAVNVASAQAGSLVNLAGTAGVRTLSGVKDATLDISSNEAVTGSQLFATNGRVTTTEGNVTSLTTQVNNLATGVGGIVTYDANTNAVNVASAQAGSLVNLAGTAGVRTLSGVKDATLDISSNEAVTGSQLFATNGRVTTTEGNVTSLTTQVNNLATGVGGIVTYDTNTNAVNVASAQAGSLVNLAGTAGVRTLSGVKDATLDISSNEAVTGSQLFATNGRVTTTEGNVTSLTTQVNNLATGVGGIVTYDTNTNAVNVASAQAGSLVNLAGTAGVRTLSGVKDATLDISSNEAVTGSQLFATNGRVTTTEGNVTSLTAQVNNLATGVGGIVTYDANTNAVNVASAQAGSLVNLAGTAGVRTLSGVKDATLDISSNEAVTGSQLFATNGRVTTTEGNVTSLTTQVNNLATGVGGIVTYDTNTNAVNVASAQAGSLVNLAGTAGVRTLSGVKDATLDISSNEAVTGSQLFATNGRVTTTEGNVTSLTTQVNNLATGVGGIVTYDTNTNAVNIASERGGFIIDAAGENGRRRITGVANGIDDGDAVTIAQLRAAGAIDPTTGGILSVITYDDASLDRAALGGSNGTVITNLGNGLIAASSREAINGGQIWEIKSSWESSWNLLRNRVGAIEKKINDGPVVGNPISEGFRPGTGKGSLKAGDASSASGTDAIAIGVGSSASGDQALAIGTSAHGEGARSVALGSGSTTDRDDELSVGSPGQERVVSNVGVGTRPNDAVNVQQMDDRFNVLTTNFNSRFNQMDRRLDRMGAIAAAYAGMATNTGTLSGKSRIGAGIGAQNGRTALAIGFQRIVGDRGNISISLGGAFSGSESSVSAGAGLSW